MASQEKAVTTVSVAARLLDLRITLFALGAMTVAGFAPLYLFPIPVLTLALLLRAWLRAPTPRRAAVLGWAFGLGFFLTGVSWVYVSLHTFGAMPAPIAALATLLFCAFLALFPAAVGYAFGASRGPVWMRLTVLAPAAWVLSEWVRGWIFTGFPWIAMGYSQIPTSPLAGFAPVVGSYGVTLLTVLTAGLVLLPFTTAKRLTHRAWIVVLVVWISGAGLREIRWTEPVGEPLTVSLLQGNIAQETKWAEEGLRETLTTYLKLTLASKAKLIVLPETALPLFLHDVPPDYLDALAAQAKRNGGDLLFGVPERIKREEYYNSVVSIGTSPSQRYRKVHLVPFGEFIPLRPVLAWIVNILAIPLQDFSRGSETAAPLQVAGQRVAVNVCYEDAFGEEIIRPLPDATLLVNVSNVAWFGRSMAPRQHLQISQARALETGRYMLRSTNTGMTAVIDQRGNIVDAATQFSVASLDATVQGYSGATPYVRWGNIPVLIVMLALLAFSAMISRARR